MKLQNTYRNVFLAALPWLSAVAIAAAPGTGTGVGTATPERGSHSAPTVAPAAVMAYPNNPDDPAHWTASFRTQVCQESARGGAKAKQTNAYCQADYQACLTGQTTSVALAPNQSIEMAEKNFTPSPPSGWSLAHLKEVCSWAAHKVYVAEHAKEAGTGPGNNCGAYGCFGANASTTATLYLWSCKAVSPKGTAFAAAEPPIPNQGGGTSGLATISDNQGPLPASDYPLIEFGWCLAKGPCKASPDALFVSACPQFESGGSATSGVQEVR